MESTRKVTSSLNSVHKINSSVTNNNQLTKYKNKADYVFIITINVQKLLNRNIVNIIVLFFFLLILK